jgi:hypothetical protein
MGTSQMAWSFIHDEIMQATYPIVYLHPSSDLRMLYDPSAGAHLVFGFVRFFSRLPRGLRNTVSKVRMRTLSSIHLPRRRRD